MSNLDDHDRDDLAVFRDLAGPPPDAMRTNWSVLQGRISRGEPRRRFWGRTTVAAVFLAAASLLIWRFVGPNSVATLGTPESPTASSDQRPPTNEVRAEQRANPPFLPIAPALEESSAASTGSDDRPRRPRAPTATASIRAEAQWMTKVRQALEEHRYAAALDMLKEHRERFSSPFMAEEARAWTAIALCGVGRYAQGRKKIASFERAYPRSPHRASIKAICAEDTATGPPP